MVTSRMFGSLEQKGDITLYRITNSMGSYVEILTYGGIIRYLCIPDKNGKLTDVVIGFDSIEGYIKAKSAYYGALIGRNCNRISNSSFELNGRTYNLYKNDGNNHLHGGKEGFDSKIWSVKELGDDYITLSLFSPHLDENYPGNIIVSVTYSFDETNILTIRYEAVSDSDTLLNMTNHAYFNLNGHNSGYIGGHYLKIYADKFTYANNESIPTGDILDVEGTVMDFRKPKQIHDGLVSDDEHIVLGNGYDHNYVIYKEKDLYTNCATAFSKESGIVLNVYTDLPGVQLYTGNYMELNVMGKDDHIYKKREAFCLETQYYPDSIHHPDWPSPIIKAYEKYDHTTAYAFSLLN